MTYKGYNVYILVLRVVVIFPLLAVYTVLEIPAELTRTLLFWLIDNLPDPNKAG